MGQDVLLLVDQGGDPQGQLQPRELQLQRVRLPSLLQVLAQQVELNNLAFM